MVQNRNQGQHVEVVISIQYNVIIVDNVVFTKYTNKRPFDS